MKLISLLFLFIFIVKDSFPFRVRTIPLLLLFLNGFHMNIICLCNHFGFTLKLNQLLTIILYNSLIFLFLIFLIIFIILVFLSSSKVLLGFHFSHLGLTLFILIFLLSLGELFIIFSFFKGGAGPDYQLLFLLTI